MIPSVSKVHKAFSVWPTVCQYDYGMISGMPPLGVNYTNGLKSLYIEDKEATDRYLKKLDEISQDSKTKSGG